MNNKENFREKFESHTILEEKIDFDFLLEGQYKEAYDTLQDAYNANLYVGIVGPVGSGKTALCRKFALDREVGFSWITFSDLIRPATLVGTFDPTLVFKLGYSIDSFVPGPFTWATLNGDIFFANEVNRGEEYVLNTLLDAMEERRLYIPQLKTWLSVDKDFFFIASMNPSDMRGTRVLPEAFKDRIKVWITLDYPKREVELKILKVNCPELTLENCHLTSIVEIIAATRDHPLITRPGSIRASISYAKLLGERSRRLSKPPDEAMFLEVGRLILLQTLEFQSGTDASRVIRDIIKKNLSL